MRNQTPLHRKRFLESNGLFITHSPSVGLPCNEWVGRVIIRCIVGVFDLENTYPLTSGIGEGKEGYPPESDS